MPRENKVSTSSADRNELIPLLLIRQSRDVLHDL